MQSGNHRRVLGRSRWELVRTACAYGVLALVAIVFTLVLRTASLIWIHNFHPMGASTWLLLKGGFRVALIVGPIQSTMLVLGVFLCTLRQANRRWRHMVFATSVVCVLDLFIRPVTIWTGYNTLVFFCMVVGLVPVTVLASHLVLWKH